MAPAAKVLPGQKSIVPFVKSEPKEESAVGDKRKAEAHFITGSLSRVQVN